jgi:hypothetical protein
MTRKERKIFVVLNNRLQGKSKEMAVDWLWQEGLLDFTRLEQLYIREKVLHLVSCGSPKMEAINQVATELNCSFEKARNAIYKRKIFKIKDGNKN